MRRHVKRLTDHDSECDACRVNPVAHGSVFCKECKMKVIERNESLIAKAKIMAYMRARSKANKYRVPIKREVKHG